MNTKTVTVVSVLFCTSPKVNDFDNPLSIAEDFVDMLYKPVAGRFRVVNIITKQARLESLYGVANSQDNSSL